MHKGIIAPETVFSLEVPEDNTVKRLDAFLGSYFEDYSRSYFQKLIDAGSVTINDTIAPKHSFPIEPHDKIIVFFPPAQEYYCTKEIDPNLDVRVIFTHPQFLIVQKPPHLLVHTPALGHEEVTLVDWLLKHFEEIRQVGTEDRPGIVHRLDKDTSGLIIIPRNNYAHNIFQEQFKNRTINKTYHAMVKGNPDPEGTIDLPIGRDSAKPTKMTHTNEHGKEATTHYKVLEYFPNTALIELKPVTGRTHQLRVHCAAIGHPIIGDAVYGTPAKPINRQALHAHKLAFEFEGKPYSFESDYPEDFKSLINKAQSNILKNI